MLCVWPAPAHSFLLLNALPTTQGHQLPLGGPSQCWRHSPAAARLDSPAAAPPARPPCGGPSRRPPPLQGGHPAAPAPSARGDRAIRPVGFCPLTTAAPARHIEFVAVNSGDFAAVNRNGLILQQLAVVFWIAGLRTGHATSTPPRHTASAARCLSSARASGHTSGRACTAPPRPPPTRP